MGVKGFLVFTFTFLILFSGAQQAQQDVISIKQKFLMRQTEDIKESVDSFRTLHLMVAGNIYQTEKHINYAYNTAEGVYDFKSELKYIQPILNLGDISIANLKTSFGNNVNDMFSAPDEFALTIKYSGINAVMHANMHTANIDRTCLKRTRDVLNEFDMYHTGAFNDFLER
ncbi:MAG: capsular biosynthesis protein, partial [Bacteroidota bacterium]|nr:capsular biosynthesis protein [Bacteroidota bacterium]